MTKVCGYLRCSSKASFNGDTWERQADAINRLAATENYDVVMYFQERAVPGKLGEESRPAFQDMIATLLDNGCRTIIVERLDRLAREYRIQEQLVIYLASKNLTLISASTGENITEAMMGDPMRRALVQIQGIIAELEKNMLLHRTKRGRERIRLRDGKCEGRYSYPNNTTVEKAIYRRMLKLQAEGKGPTRIAEILNAEGLLTRYAKPWFRGTVSKILRRTDRHKSAVSKRQTIES